MTVVPLFWFITVCVVLAFVLVGVVLLFFRLVVKVGEHADRYTHQVTAHAKHAEDLADVARAAQDNLFEVTRALGRALEQVQREVDELRAMIQEERGRRAG